MDQASRDESQAVEDVTDVVEEALGGSVPTRPAARVGPALAMAREAAERAAARAEAGATTSRAWGRDAMMVVRRSHLYAGLLLYPWVLLYGVTAFLFNHPTAFPDQTVLRFGREATRGTALDRLPTAADAAAKVVEALNARSEGGAEYALIKPESARFERGAVTARAKAGDGQSYAVTLDSDGGLARTLTPAQVEAAEGAAGGGRGGMAPNPGGGRAAPRGGEGGGEAGPEGGDGTGARRGRGGVGEAPFATAGLDVQVLEPGPIREALPAVLAKAGLASPEVSDVRLAPLSFQMEADGKPWLVTYNATTGVVSGRSVQDPASQAELTTRRFLLRLHLIHGYPSEFGRRWIWAFLVDCVAFLMVFWAISGIAMWWQIKRTRRVGAAALALSTAAAAWIGVGMHDHFVGGGR